MTSKAPPRLEPMTLGGILDRSVRLVADNFPLMLNIVLVVGVPLLATQATVFLLISWLGDSRFLPLLGPPAVALLNGFLFTPFLTVALVHVVSAFYLEKPISVGAAYAPALGMLLSILWVNFLAGVFIGLGAMLLLIPGLIYATRYALVVPVRVLEGLRGMQALNRSRELTKNFGWKVFGMLIASGAVSMIVTLGSTSLLPIVIDTKTTSGTLLVQLIQQAVALFVLPVTVSFSILMYYDLRIRKEGFDLEMLSQSLSIAPNARPTISDVQPQAD